MIALLLGAVPILVLLVALLAPAQLSALALLLAALFHLMLPRVGLRSAYPGFSTSLLLLLGLWGAFTSLWSLDPIASLVQALQFSAIVVFGHVMSRYIQALPNFERRLVPIATLAALVISSVLVLAALIAEQALGRIFMSGSLGQGGDELLGRFNRFDAVLCLTAFPILLLLTRIGVQHLSGAVIPAAFLLILFLLLHLQMKTVLIAFMVGMVAWCATMLWPRLGKAVSVTVVLLCIGLPWVFVPLAPYGADGIGPSGLHRLIIWEFVQERIAERPIQGWGMDSSRMIPGGDALASANALGMDMTQLPQWSAIVRAEAEKLPLHPHNSALQIVLEIGVVGFLIVLAFLASFMKWLFSLPLRREDMACCLATLCCAITIASSSFGVWQTWWLAGVVFAMLLCQLAIRSSAFLPKGPELRPFAEQS